MQINLLLIGKTNEKYLEDGISIYENRLKKYINFNIEVIIPSKKHSKLTELEQKKHEFELLSSKFRDNDYIVLLDEKGKLLSSEDYSVFINKRMNSGIKNLVFIIGGAYGADERLKKRADYMLSLSKMTFSHQMVRLFFFEQTYRAFTILNNEPYHHS